MKRIIIILISLLAIFRINALEKGNFGIRATFDLSIPGNWNVNHENMDLFKPGAGFSIGGVYYRPLGKSFYLEPGISFFYNTYSFKDLSITGADGTIKSEDPSVRKSGIRIPVHFGYEFSLTDKWKLALYTGPEVNYVFSKTAHVKHRESLGEDFDPKTLGIDEHRNFDVAWKIGITVPFNYLWVGMDAAIGLTDLQPGKVSFRENRVSVTTTYYF